MSEDGRVVGCGAVTSPWLPVPLPMCAPDGINLFMGSRDYSNDALSRRLRWFLDLIGLLNANQIPTSARFWT